MVGSSVKVLVLRESGFGSESIKGVLLLRCVIRILTAGMAHQTRRLTEKDVREIVEDLRKELNDALKYLEKGEEEGGRPLSNLVWCLPCTTGFKDTCMTGGHMKVVIIPMERG